VKRFSGKTHGKPELRARFGNRGKSPGGYPSRGHQWSDDRASQPLTLSLSLWERERCCTLRAGSLSHGERAGVRGDSLSMTRHAQRPRLRRASGRQASAQTFATLTGFCFHRKRIGSSEPERQPPGARASPRPPAARQSPPQPRAGTSYSKNEARVTVRPGGSRPPHPREARNARAPALPPKAETHRPSSGGSEPSAYRIYNMIAPEPPQPLANRPCGPSLSTLSHLQKCVSIGAARARRRLWGVCNEISCLTAAGRALSL
jgi:hypothetical protein